MKSLMLLLLVAHVTCAQARDLNREYQRIKVTLAGKAIEVYLADTELRREQGLMFVRELPKNTGMLFVFPQEQPVAFWMKNTLIPLSIGYFNKKGELVDVQEMAVPASIMDQRPPSYPSKKPAMYALEMNRNWFTENKIKAGAKLILPKAARP